LTRRTAIGACAGAALASLSAGQTANPAATGRWALQYFYDKDDESFRLNDLFFASPRFGIAVGVTQQKLRRPKPVALITRDGGAKWEEQNLPDFPSSVFFRNDSLGWMVGSKGIWRTEEGAREWKRVKKTSEINRVYFRDDQLGWALGREKTILKTTDGGRNWTAVPEAETPSTNPEYTSYNWMEWAGGENAIIVGSAIPPRRTGWMDRPAWVDPLSAAAKRQWPATTIAMETTDSGQTWKSQTVPAFGATTRLRATADGYSLILVRFYETFDYPSEVYLSKPKGGGLNRLFREKNRIVTDLHWWSPAKVLLATIEPPGRLHQLPIPGKLHMLTSTDMVNWTEMKVDYRAVGTEAVLAFVDEKNIWVGTDAGHILRYTE
jgi:photosystem II stability/assembly factor-like uncharacterized protein